MRTVKVKAADLAAGDRVIIYSPSSGSSGYRGIAVVTKIDPAYAWTGMPGDGYGGVLNRRGCGGFTLTMRMPTDIWLTGHISGDAEVELVLATDEEENAKLAAEVAVKS